MYRTHIVKIHLTLTALILLLGSHSTLFAQALLPDAPQPVVQPSSPTFVKPQNEEQHKFFDRWNIVLFAGTAALASTDFAVTRANLQNNGRELNPVVRVFGRSTAGLALNFAGEAAGSVGLSYFFHRTGHHKLERMVSAVNIGASAAAVGYSLAHR